MDRRRGLRVPGDPNHLEAVNKGIPHRSHSPIWKKVLSEGIGKLEKHPQENP